MADLEILGIGGTFMASLALLARQKGLQVTGCDRPIYPPMSDQLKQAGIAWRVGFDNPQLPPADQYVVGNVMTRGLPVVESLLNSGRHYISGPQWLAEQVLADKIVLAVAGTHGKTTTSSMLAWILDQAGLEPGFLIGGIPANFGQSARLGQGRYFVVEADEYDSAFFDKRSKFIHYRPQTVVINNLEFDHGDIFADLAAIQRQFHHLIRTIPSQGRIIAPQGVAAIDEVLAQGCWTTVDFLHSGEWSIQARSDDWRCFELFHQQKSCGEVRGSMLGHHNASNALAAMVAAHSVGVAPEQAIAALGSFRGIKRRMEWRGSVNQVTVYDDFAHHPTAITATLLSAKARWPRQRVIGVVEMRSNTMKMGIFQQALKQALAAADYIVLVRSPAVAWDLSSYQQANRCHVVEDVAQAIDHLVAYCHQGDQVIIMSNGGFDNIHQRLLAAL